MSEGIINLGEYLRRREGPRAPPSTFALWGAEGERSRLALPLWRAIYLLSGERGGIVWDLPGGEAPHPFVVLDLAHEPARTRFPWHGATEFPSDHAPEVVAAPDGGLAVYLGSYEGRRWFLLVVGGREGVKRPAGRDMEELLFLAGECAGLLFLRDFAEGAE